MTTVIFDLSLLILTLSPRTPACATKQEIGIAKTEKAGPELPIKFLCI